MSEPFALGAGGAGFGSYPSTCATLNTVNARPKILRPDFVAVFLVIVGEDICFQSTTVVPRSPLRTCAPTAATGDTCPRHH